jgi:hypothetical protein
VSVFAASGFKQDSVMGLKKDIDCSIAVPYRLLLHFEARRDSSLVY